MLDQLTDEQCLQLYRKIVAHPPTEETVQALNSILEAFAQPRRHVLLAELMSISDRAFVWHVWDDVLSFPSKWERTKPEETARWLADQGTRYLPARQISKSVSTAIYNWGDKDPRAASEFTVALPPDTDPKSPVYWYLRKVVCGRSAGDLAGTLARAEALPDDRRRTVALLGVLDQMAKADPVQAENSVQRQLGSNKDAPEFAAQLVLTLADDSKSLVRPESIGQWVLSLPNPSVRRVALNSLMDVWLTKVDTNWMRFEELPQVVPWANALPSNDTRSEVWTALAATWGLMRPNKAKEWLHSLPDGPDRNAATSAYDEAVVATARQKFTGKSPGSAFYGLQANLPIRSAPPKSFNPCS